MKFRIDNIHVAYIHDNLIDDYRTLFNIPEGTKTQRMLIDILYSDILQASFRPMKVEEDLKFAKKIAEYNKFDNLGDMIEFVMHNKIIKNNNICMSCPRKLPGGYCTKMDIMVNDYFCYCNKSGTVDISESVSETLDELSKLQEKGELL